MAHALEPLLASYSPGRTGFRLRLFCFPFAGAGASVFREWPSDLPPEVQVFGIQLPGRENRLDERPFTDVPSLAQAIAGGLQSYHDLPFALFGHSIGALLAFEVARELRRLKQTGPAHLFASGYRAPSLPFQDVPVHNLERSLLIQELRLLGGTPADLLESDAAMDALLPAIRADFELSETYRYEQQEPLQCPITVFGGLYDRKVKNSDLPAWQKETQSPFTIRMFPGDHYFIRSCRVPLLLMIADKLGVAAPKKV